jgi:biotin synthase-related radical SAM superfamily protein
MSESNLRKEFSKRDVQRMRNIITGNAGGATGVQSGYTKQSQDHQEGDVWEEGGKQWTIKNGIKQTVTKFDKLKKMVVIPLSCPHCNQPIKLDDINKKMWAIHHKCFDCVIKMEAEIKRSGKWDEYEKQMLNNNKNAMVDDFETSVEEFYKMQVESYITEQGDMESWGGGKINEDEIKNVKEYIKKLREQEL